MMKTKNEKESLKSNIKNIASNLQDIFKSKDKKLIIKSIGNILYTIFVVIILKIPFVFVKTLFLDFLNSHDVKLFIQTLVADFFEFVYIFVAALVLYKYFKKYFGNK